MILIFSCLRHEALFAEAEEAILADDDVVVDEDIERLGRLLNRLGEADVCVGRERHGRRGGCARG